VAHDFAGERIIVADSGGGSTELATGVYAPERGVFALEGTRSLDIGCRRVTERFFSALPPSTDELAAAAGWANEQFAGYFESLPVDFERAERLVAVGGTVTTLVALVHELEPYDSNFVPLRELSMEQISAAIDRMSTLDVEGIAALPGVQPKRAVDGLTLTIPHGSFTVLVGPSGCGKTTLLRMIAGLEEITEGEIRMGDINITNLEPGDRGLAMVFQNYALYPHMTVRENIEFGLVNARLPRFEIRERVQKALDIVGMGEYADRRPGRISGGQRQRVALARAISKMPECFLMDEPLSNLDAKLRSDMRTELIQLHDTLKSTFIYVTHDQIEAMTMGTNIVVMNEGRIMQQGTPTEIHNDPNCVFVARFIGDPGMNIIPCPSGLQVGFRPRDVQFDCTEKGTDGIVVRKAIKSFENHGSEFLYLLDSGEQKVFVKELSKTRRQLNEPLVFRLEKQNLYVFDVQGKRVYEEEVIQKAYEEFAAGWQTV